MGEAEGTRTIVRECNKRKCLVRQGSSEIFDCWLGWIWGEYGSGLGSGGGVVQGVVRGVKGWSEGEGMGMGMGVLWVSWWDVLRCAGIGMGSFVYIYVHIGGYIYYNTL